jgi:cytochrome c peroxidase
MSAIVADACFTAMTTIRNRVTKLRCCRAIKIDACCGRRPQGEITDREQSGVRVRGLNGFAKCTVLAALLFGRDSSSAATASASGPTNVPQAPAESFYATRFSRAATVEEMANLGRRMFFDPGLSASGRLSCATCHDPGSSFAPANGLPVQRGGIGGTQAGLRAVPSLRYLQSVPPFTEHMHDADGDDSIDQGPAGGRTWDGRAQTVHDQARLPLLSPREMANGSPGSVVAKLRRASYADTFRDVFGRGVLEDEETAFKAGLLALEVFQQTPREFYPYDSKYDAYLRGQAKLTRSEANGLALFNDPSKGNCAICHPSAIKEGKFPAFTDYGYVAVGVPRNSGIPANRDPDFFDLGLCGPERTDLKDREEYCGLFRTPSLRNVATRHVFFHNGAFNDLRRVVTFYVERDTHPSKWYPRNAQGTVRKFDDLPAKYHENVNREPPFDRGPGDKPALSRAEIDDVIAFLKTLTDRSRR